MKYARIFTIVGALSGCISVAAGAFGAHALKLRLGPDQLAVFETGARYQMYHALALLAAAWASSQWAAPAIRGAGWCFILGTLLSL
jgi:uncharacterized membrane protein YgdD (TMEM256/DUF423 family)